MSEYVFSRTKYLIDILNVFGKNSPHLVDARSPDHWSCRINGKVCHDLGALVCEGCLVHPHWCVVKESNKS